MTNIKMAVALFMLFFSMRRVSHLVDLGDCKIILLETDGECMQLSRICKMQH
jgi:serine/threonine protein phosphatase PrpC